MPACVCASRSVRAPASAGWKLTVFFLHDHGFILDALEQREQSVCQECGCDAESADEDDEDVGLFHLLRNRRGQAEVY